MKAWHGKVALVTGGGSGIGRALCLALARRGVRVLVTDINLEAAQTVAGECGGPASATRLDVVDAEAVKACIEDYAASCGRLDFLFNNAGIAVAGEAHEIPLPMWRQVIDIDVYGVLHGVLAAYPIMLKQGFGHIVNTASLAGLVAAPLLTPYGLAKHAVVGLSSSLRIEAASHGVRVSALCPAAIETPLIDTQNPVDSPVPWIPNVRRFLTTLGGPPYPVDRCAEETLDAVERNLAVIVLPGQARLAWRLGRWFPALVEIVAKKAVAIERSERQ